MAPRRVDDLDFLTPMAKAGGAEQPVNIPAMKPRRIPVAPPSRPDTVFNAQGRAWAQDRYGTSDPQAMSNFYNAERMYRRLGAEQMQGIAAAMSLQPQRPAAPSNPFGVTPQALQNEYENTYKALKENFEQHDPEYQNWNRAQDLVEKLGEQVNLSFNEEDRNDPNYQLRVTQLRDAQEYLNAKKNQLREKQELFIRNNPHFRSLEPYVPIPTLYTPNMYGDADSLPPVPDVLRGYFADPFQPQPASNQSPRGPVAPPQSQPPSTYTDDDLLQMDAF